jgi:hypothetical protein
MKTYVITLSKRFPAGHNRAGDLTFFHEALANALYDTEATLVVDDEEDISLKSSSAKSTQFGRITRFGPNVSPRLNGVRLAYQFDNGRVNLTTVNRLKLPG